MQTAPPSPAEEITILRRMVAERDAVIMEREAVLAGQREELARVRAETEARQAEIDKLRFLIKQLQRSMYGPRSEKLDPDQLQLGLEDVEQSIGMAEAAAEAAQAKQPMGERRGSTSRRNRGNLPKHLPREEIVIEPESIALPRSRRPSSTLLNSGRCSVHIPRSTLSVASRFFWLKYHAL